MLLKLAKPAFICSVAISGFSLSSAGQEPPVALAQRLVLLLKYDQQADTLHQQCLKSQTSVSPESLFARSPNYFDGITPDSPQWPNIVVAYADYYQKICSRPTKQELIQTLSSAYAKAMTPAELQESINFYLSPTGHALISANQEAAAAAYEEFARLNAKYASDLLADLSEKIRALSPAK